MHDQYQDPAIRWDLHDEDATATARAYERELDRELGIAP